MIVLLKWKSILCICTILPYHLYLLNNYARKRLGKGGSINHKYCQLSLSIIDNYPVPKNALFECRYGIPKYRDTTFLIKCLKVNMA